MGYTPAEVNYLQSLFSAYKDVLGYTTAIVASTKDQQIMSLANDTLADVARNLDNLFWAFMYGGLTPQGLVEPQDSQDMMAYGFDVTKETEKALKKWRGVFGPTSYKG